MDDGDDVFALGWSREDGEPCASLEMLLQVFSSGEETSAFKNDVNSQIAPGKLGGVFLMKNLVFLLSYHQSITVNFYGSFVPAIDGVILQQIGEVVCWNDVVDRNQFQLWGFEDDLESRSAYSPQSVNRYLGHNRSPFLSVFCFCLIKTLAHPGRAPEGSVAWAQAARKLLTDATLYPFVSRRGQSSRTSNNKPIENQLAQ